ncbi:MAG: hypothetical protein ACYS1A_08960 [Planctomycetota bacterium]|jgi:hypothetical protein
MKKLLIMMFVFWMSSGANATLSLDISVGGSPYTGELLAVGTTVDVAVVQDVPNSAGSGGEMTVTMYASGLTTTDTTPPFAPYSGWDWLFSGGVAAIDNGDGTWDVWFAKTGNVASGFGMNGTPGIGSWVGYAPYGGWPYVSTVEFSFVVTQQTDLVWGGTWDGVDMTGVNGGTIKHIPEPEPEAEQIDLQFPYDSNIVPYAQKKEQEKEESLKCCPSGQGLIPVTEELSAKESKGRELPLGSGFGGIMMEMDSIIDISSDITSNTVWTADNTYHIIADINVQALLVIEPGTVVKFASNKSMSVNNGGTLISTGTPNSPVIYTSDSDTPGYNDYYCPINIEETASDSTKVTYSLIEYAYAGIVVLNKRLDASIENNYFYNNVYGIVEQGTEHTNICNNLIFKSYYSGIEVFLESTTSQADANSHILIENNTCDYYQYCGITVHGVPDLNDAGVVVLANNIVSESYQYGLNLVDGYMYAPVLNTGYYDNASNKNWEFEEDNPVIETIFPYETGTGYLPVCYLDQDCNFIDTGYRFIEQTPMIGKTTATTGVPDSNYVDIGFHYPNWYFSNPGSGDSLLADLDDSMKVDFKDFAIFANYWQQSTSGDADLDGSGFVDYNDLSIFTDQWLQVADPNIEIHISGDSNEGYVDVGVSGFTSDTQQVFLLVDGQYIGEIFGFENGGTLYLDISSLSAGTHQLKAISTSTASRITCSNLKEDAFSCFLRYCMCPEAYEPNKPLLFCAFYSGAGDVLVKAFEFGEQNPLWSQTYPGDNIYGCIPAEITAAYDIDYVEFEDTLTGGAGAAAAGTSVAKPTEIIFNPPKNTRALLILPVFKVNRTNSGVIKAVKETFESRGVPYDALGCWRSNSNKLAWCAENCNIDYIYYCGHGGFIKNGVLRTHVEIDDGYLYSFKPSGVRDGFSLYDMGFSDVTFAWFDCCFTGHLVFKDNELVIGDEGQQPFSEQVHNDMSLALRMNSAGNHFYQGWYGERPTGMLGYVSPSTKNPYHYFCLYEWEKLKEGYSLFDALSYSIQEVNKLTFGEDAINEYRIRGQGYINEITID